MKIFNSDCPHCGTRSVAFTIHIEVLFHEHHRYWDTFSVCGLCGRGVVGDVSKPWPSYQGGDTKSENYTRWLRNGLTTGRLRTRRNTPGNISRQGRDSLLSRNWTAAAMMYRKTLESGLKSKFLISRAP